MHFILIPKHPSFSPNLLKVLSVLFGCLLFLGVIYFFLIKRDLDLEWIVLGRVMGVEKWAAFDAPYQSFGTWIHCWNFLDPVSKFWHLDRNPETAK